MRKRKNDPLQSCLSIHSFKWQDILHGGQFIPQTCAAFQHDKRPLLILPKSDPFFELGTSPILSGICSVLCVETGVLQALGAVLHLFFMMIHVNETLVTSTRAHLKLRLFVFGSWLGLLKAVVALINFGK